MRVRKFSSFIFATTLLSITACMGPLKTSSSGQEYEANMRLMAMYSEVEGTYEGQLVDNPNGEAPYPARLEIFIAQQENGRNEDGDVKLVPVLRASYRRLDVDDVRRTYFIPSVRYYQESGELRMIVGEDMQSGIPGSGYLSIEGRVTDEGFDGKLIDHRGPQGVLRLEKL